MKPASVRYRSQNAGIHFSGTAGLMPADRDSCELLRAVARRPSCAAAGKELYRFASRVCDWDSLFRLAEEHRMLPMLFSRLADVGSAVPLIVQERLRTEYHRNLFHSLANA